MCGREFVTDSEITTSSLGRTGISTPAEDNFKIMEPASGTQQYHFLTGYCICYYICGH